MISVTKIKTLMKLGLGSILRVGLYRTGLKSGLHPVLRQEAKPAQGSFFRPSERAGYAPSPNILWDKFLRWYGHYLKPISDGPPDWFENPFSDAPQPAANSDWWSIPDFDSGDIKGLWELSRFDWLVAAATKAAHGDDEALVRLNLWLADWSLNNPPYKGPHWKCGQEASIRVMHMCLAAWILGQENKLETGLVNLLVTHLQRIAPTISYAIGQRNNHGTSEAAALFIGGSILADHDKRSHKWAKMGRYWLEERAQTLIEPDGSFSQYSVTYHRVMLDSYSLAEAWRRQRFLPAFSSKLMMRLQSAALWLEAMTDPKTGDAPNMGANDGAHLLQLTGSDYRDFRPSVQLASALFSQRDVFGAGPWNDQLRWLNIPAGETADALTSRSFDDGGYHVMLLGKARAIMRYPRFRFRPSQADALHVDLWYDGRNLLRDAGSYSYNAEGSDWFDGTSAHNSITFDGRDQMPRLSRFLFGDWLIAKSVECVVTENSIITAAAAYQDNSGAWHRRTIALDSAGMTCIDEISGHFTEAQLVWRLEPGDWHVDGKNVLGNELKLTVDSDDIVIAPKLSTTRESRYYQLCEDIPLVTIGINRPTIIRTRLEF